MSDTARSTPGRGHVHAVDVVRVLTFAAVIGVHTTSAVDGSVNVTSNGVVMLLHFTREAFFVLTGFVLVHQYFGREYSIPKFYRRRLLTVGVPYVTWTVFYTALTWYGGPRTQTFGAELRLLVHNLIFGTAWYHLYFLLVSMQVYLLYPLIAWLLRVTRRHHALLLAVSGALQLAAMSWVNSDPHLTGLAAAVLRHDTILVLTYQFYVLLGAVAAMHRVEIGDWFRTHRTVVVLVFVATGGLAEAWYFHRQSSMAASTAASVLQPVMVPWVVGVVGMLFLLGVVWSDRRRAGSLADRFLQTASDRSFGIYLCHPLVLWYLTRPYRHWFPAGMPALLRTVVIYSLTVLGAVALTEVFRRSPLSLPLTGRSRRRTPRPARTATRKDTTHATQHPDPASARQQAAHGRRDDGDRRRPADAHVLRHDGELQRAD